MSRRSALIIGAIVLFAAGGALLAFAGDSGAAIGTVCGLVAVGLLGWAFFRSPAS